MAIARHFEFPEPVSSPYTESKANRVEVIPYVEVNGVRLISDAYLTDVFNKLVEEGLLSVVFEGIIFRSALDFIKLMKSPANIVCFVMSDTQCIGFAWLNGIGVNSAYGHFCYFKNDECTSIEAGKKVLSYWFSLPGKDGPFLDVILGTIPSFNTKASHYIQKLGFVKLGDVPNLYKNPFTGEKWASMIHYMVRP